MYCPGCAAENSVEVKFCRSCGLNLEQAAESLLAQMPNGRRTDLEKSQRRLDRLGTVAFGGLGLVGLIGVIAMIYAILVKFILNGASVISGVIFIALLVFAVLGLTYVIINESLKEKKLKARNPYFDTASEKTDTNKLIEERDFQPVPSVVESTTSLLDVRTGQKKTD